MSGAGWDLNAGRRVLVKSQAAFDVNGGECARGLHNRAARGWGYIIRLRLQSRTGRNHSIYHDNGHGLLPSRLLRQLRRHAELTKFAREKASGRTGSVNAYRAGPHQKIRAKSPLSSGKAQSLRKVAPAFD